jgi:hypothetical protein
MVEQHGHHIDALERAVDVSLFVVGRHAGMHSGVAVNELVQPENGFIGLGEGAEGGAIEAAELSKSV